MKAKGLLERIGLNESLVTHKPTGGETYKLITDIPDHTTGINMVMEVLCDPEHGVIKNVNEIKAVGHRVVNGGENYKESVLIDNDVKKTIEECIELAPLHNPANLKGILSVEKLIPGVPQVAVFDTSFHQTMPDYAYMYALPYEYYEKYRIRKYGFHGIAYTYMVEKGAALIGKDLKNIRIIMLMLGGGSSITAVKNGISIDTSMGFTPAEGLIMSTRCGDIDPAILTYLMNKENIGAKEIDNIINKQSGILGLSKKYSDFINIQKGVRENDTDCIRAFDCYCYRIKKYIGAYAAVMDGVDLIIFGGGIGENSPMAREKILADLSILGISLDREINNNDKLGERLISSDKSKVPVCVAKVDEELIIARETYNLVKN